MFSVLLSNPYTPFTYALFILAFLLVMETIGLISSVIDFDIDADFPPFLATIFPIKKVPFVVLLCLYCASFAVMGFYLCSFKIYNPWWSVGFSFCFTALIAEFLSRILPNSKSEAISLAELEGYSATVTMSNITGRGQCKVIDEYGNSKWVSFMSSKIYHVGNVVVLGKFENNYFRINSKPII